MCIASAPVCTWQWHVCAGRPCRHACVHIGSAFQCSRFEAGMPAWEDKIVGMWVAVAADTLVPVDEVPMVVIADVWSALPSVSTLLASSELVMSFGPSGSIAAGKPCVLLHLL